MEENKQQASSGGSKKMFWIILIIIVVLAAGAGAYYWYSSGNNSGSYSAQGANGQNGISYGQQPADNSGSAAPANSSQDAPPVQTQWPETNIIKSSTIQNMKVDVLQEGSGEAAKAGDTVTMNYSGYLADGTEFDSNVNPQFSHVQPFQFTIGPDCQKNNNCVIEGWNLGVTGMKVGEKRKLTIPPELGYGAAGAGGGVIPPNATLIFDVELLKIN